MASLWFIVPAHGRVSLSAICLRQLRRTCDALTAEGVEATAVVIACDENLDTARDLGFGTIERPNHFLGQRFNDGIQAALDRDHNPRPADYVVPCGSDDWVDYRLFLDLPPFDTMRGFQHISFVRADGGELKAKQLGYPGGCGIRVYSRQIMSHLGYRPADEDRKRACDTSILVNLRNACRFRIEHPVNDPLQIVDWKSPSEQLNAYDDIDARYRTLAVHPDPFAALRDVFPAEALAEMQNHYVPELVAA